MSRRRQSKAVDRVRRRLAEYLYPERVEKKVQWHKREAKWVCSSLLERQYGTTNNPLTIPELETLLSVLEIAVDDVHEQLSQARAQWRIWLLFYFYVTLERSNIGRDEAIRAVKKDFPWLYGKYSFETLLRRYKEVLSRDRRGQIPVRKWGAELKK